MPRQDSSQFTSSPRRFSVGAVFLGLLLSACATASPPTATPILPTSTPFTPTAIASPLPSLTPLPTVTLGPTLPPLPTVIAPTDSGTIRPSATSALLAMATTMSPSQAPSPSAGTPSGNKPPIRIQLPANWTTVYGTFPVNDIAQGIQTTGNFADYSGPLLNGATGTILVLWGFPTVMPVPKGISATGNDGTLTPDLQKQAIDADGVRLLPGTVVDVSCNTGHYGQHDFSVGGLPAVGESFAAAQCQGEADTAGWFAGVNEFGMNILFYSFVVPVSANNDAKKPLQNILDTVVFDRSAATGDTAQPTQQVTPQPTTALNVTMIPTTTPALH